MPSTKNGGNIKFGIDFEANQASLNKLKKSLQDLQKVKFGNFDGSRQEFNEVKSRISEIQDLIRNAFNPTLNTSNITAFKSELEKSGMSLKQIQSDFSRFGSTGDRAFNQLTTSVLTTNLKLKETNSLIDNMGKTMVNTVKWGIASSVMNTFTQSVQGAFQYVQSLEKSLTNIRIVTGDSTEKMAQFAEQANRSAQALGRSTLDYTKASLTYYQQGLNAEDVQARTEATLKAQNITGAGSQMADYLTAVWNGYKVANEEAELYVDKLAAVADSSASDMSQLAIAMSKVASTANTMGVDVDQLNAQIATVVATTRQAPESVGTAFKTIYTRMNDIKAGSDEAEISLGRYSGKMAELGFNVLDATGNLRDTGQVMEEIGDRWQDLTREQQVYLAQTMGGQRQVNQLMALFDNWTTYSELLNTSLESEGTLAEKNSRYMESLGAKMEQLGAAGERVKDALIDSDSMKTVIEALTSVTNLVANLFETMGSGQTILLALGSTMTQLFNGTIAKEINNVIVNMQNMKANAQTIKNQLEMTKMVQEVGKGTPGGTLVADRMAEIQQYYSVMDQASINNQKNLIAERGQVQNNILKIEEEREAVKKLAKQINEEGEALDWSVVNGATFQELNDALGNMQDSLSNVKDLASKDLFENWEPLSTTAQNFSQHFNKFVKDYKEINPEKAEALEKLFNDFSNNIISGGSFSNQLAKALNEANREATQFSNTISNSKKELDDAKNRAALLDKAIKDGADSAKQLFDVTNAVKMVSAIGQISSSLMTFKNLGSIWSDKDVSTGEKIAKTFTSLGFVIPSLVNGWKNLREGSLGLLKTEASKLAVLKLQTLELERQERLKKISATKDVIEKTKDALKKSPTKEDRDALRETLKKAEGELDVLEVKNDLVNKQIGETKQHIIDLQKNSVEGGALLGEALPGILSNLSLIAPVLIGIGVAVAAIVIAYKEWNKEADAAKKAKQVAEDTKRAYDDLKTSLENVKSALNDFHSAEDKLNGLTKGTQEWRDALQQCNDKVLELISNYPELAQYVTNVNGQLKLNTDGEQVYLDRLQAGVQNARNASYIAGSNSRDADVTAMAADIGHNSFYTTQKEKKNTLYNTKSKQTVSDYASAKQVLEIVKAIDKLIEGGADLKNGLAGLADEIENQTGLDTKLIKAVLSNEDALLQLRTQLQQNETADKLMYETMAQGALANNSTFKGMDELGQQVASAIGGADLEKATQDAYDHWVGRMSGMSMDRFDSGAEVTDILDALNKAQGTNWGMASNAVRGGEGNRTLAFLDQQGKLHELTRQQIASTIAAKQALQDLGTSAETASKMLANIDTKVSGNAQNAVKQWIAGQDITDINKAGLQELPKDLLQLFNEDQLKSLAKARGIDTQKNKDWQNQLQQDWENSLQDLSSSFDDVTKDASRSVREAFNSIKDDDTIKQATLGTQQEIVAQMQQTFNKGGSKALGQLTDFYSKLEDTDSKDGLSALDAFSKVTKDFDFNTGNVEDFKQALKEAGVETTASTQAIQAYINAQKQASKLSPEQNYKSVHDIIDNLKRNDTIDAEQAATLEAAGVNVKEFFKLTADGSYKLKADAEVFQQYINGITIQPFKAKMDQLQNKIDSIHSFGEGGQFEKYSSQNMGIDEFSNAAGTISNIVGTDAQAVTSQDTEKLQAQVQFLKMVGEEDAAIRQAEVAINEGRTLGATDLQRISELVKQHSDQYQNLSELEKQYLQDMLDTQQQIADASDRGLDEDVDETKWENLSEHLQEYADQIDEVSDQLKNNAEVADDVAQAMLRYDSAIGQVQKNYNDWLQALTSGSIEDQVQATEDLENVYSDLLDLPFDNILSADFLQNVDNLNLLKQAANGSEQAYNQLAQAAAQDIAINAGMDTSDFEAGKDLIQSYTQDGVAFDDIEVGAFLDDANFIQGLNEMINATDMSVQQATDLLASMGVDAQVEAVKVPEQDKQQFINATPNVAYEDVAAPISVLDGLGNVTWDESNTVKVPRINYDLKPTNETADKESTATVLRVKSARKASGGGFKYKNSSAGNRGGGSGKKGGGGGKKGGGGGGGKAKEPNKAKGATNKADRYRNNTVKANKLANSMTKLQKQQERLTGKDSLKNLQKQLQILKKQNETIGERIRLQRKEQDQLANNLKQSGATFDKDGTLNNYFKVHANIMKKYNDAVAKWNQMSAEQQQKNKEYLNNAKEEMDNALKDLQRYDKLQQEIAKSIQQQIDNAQAQIDLKVKQFEIKINAELDLSKAKRDWNEFKKNVIDEVREDDILGLNNYRFTDISTYFNNDKTGTIQVLTQQLKKIMGDQGNNIFSAQYFSEKIGEMSITDRQAKLKQIKSLFDSLKDEMEGVKQLADEIRDSVFDSIDALQEIYEEEMDEYEFIGDVLNHNMRIIESMYGDQAYDKMAKYYDKIEENNNRQLKALSIQRDNWYNLMKTTEKDMRGLDPNSNRYQDLDKKRKEYEKLWKDTSKDFQSLTEDTLDNVMDKYANAINNILLNFDLSLGGGKALDDIADEWDMLNDLADTYLDKINSAYEIEKLQNAFDDAINDNEGNIAAQQSLNNLMEQQLAYLKDKEKLTQYDVDRANTLLQIEMKRLALEQSRNNKNRLRLRRDSQGNYTYQYTADTEAMNKAEQELADARNSLYNSDKAAYVDNLSAIQKSASDLEDKLKDVWNDSNLDYEQKLQKQYELQKYYGQKINDLVAENTSIRNNLMDSAFEELAKMYNISPDQFRAMSKEEQDKIFKDIIPQANSYTAQMVDNILGAGGISKFLEDIANAAKVANDDKAAAIGSIQNEIIDSTDVLIEQSEHLLDNNKQLLDLRQKQLEATQQDLYLLSTFLDQYSSNSKDSAINVLKAAHEIIANNEREILGISQEVDKNTANNQKASMEQATKQWTLKNFAEAERNAIISKNSSEINTKTLEAIDKINQEYNNDLLSARNDLLSTINNSNTNDLFSAIDNNIFNSINNILNSILETNQEYYATSLAKQDAIREAVVANQTVNINADFPNAKDVNNIIRAIEELTLVAAQRAGTTIKGGAGGSRKG